jgi:16S rRNA (adenine1518-N6/adenine1519-N6)-dimethyltransferase
MGTEPVRVRKRFGQHFLVDAWAQKVVDAIGPQPDDLFVEIGPGRGALTAALAARAARVVAVEIDRDLAGRLEAHAPTNLTVIAGDFLAIDVVGLMPGPPGQVRVAGNLPYNIASPILLKLADLHASTGAFSDATLMLQREVAERLVASPGGKEYGVLGILIQMHADVRRLLTIPPGAFRPAPKVWSALVRLTFQPPRIAVADAAAFSRMIAAVFTRRRKMLLNALGPYARSQGADPGDALALAGIDARRRPETLTLAEFGRLAAVLTRH